MHRQERAPYNPHILVKVISIHYSLVKVSGLCYKGYPQSLYKRLATGQRGGLSMTEIISHHRTIVL